MTMSVVARERSYEILAHLLELFCCFYFQTRRKGRRRTIEVCRTLDNGHPEDCQLNESGWLMVHRQALQSCM